MTTDEAIKILYFAKWADGQDVDEIIEAISTVSTALERDRWISVEEATPEHGKKYLVCAIGTYYGVRIVETARFSNVWGWMTYEGEPMEAEVTHYRPLPEPPKEDKP